MSSLCCDTGLCEHPGVLCPCQGPHWQLWSGSYACSAQGQPFLARCHQPEIKGKAGHAVFKRRHILLLQLPHVCTFLEEITLQQHGTRNPGSATHKRLRLQLEWPCAKPDPAELFLGWMEAEGAPALLPQSCWVHRDSVGWLQPCPWGAEGFLCKDCLHRRGARRARGTAGLGVFLGGWLGVLSCNPSRKQL